MKIFGHGGDITEQIARERRVRASAAVTLSRVRRPDSEGLCGIAERAEALGGKLPVVRPGAGTTVELRLP